MPVTRFWQPTMGAILGAKCHPWTVRSGILVSFQQTTVGCLPTRKAGAFLPETVSRSQKTGEAPGAMQVFPPFPESGWSRRSLWMKNTDGLWGREKGLLFLIQTIQGAAQFPQSWFSGPLRMVAGLGHAWTCPHR
ncbi:hypothetical protein [Desulfitobacterium sp.]|uniref:hypothetical protein n=1 Tax=Desulfitobacterium sp. TaxID=49981 RepID=UPI002C959B77|nr:hypothetical protein [Desulfitobacterium sp.]HVJ49081.1 hypothetical protein [Desulfitobacterium sp.]